MEIPHQQTSLAPRHPEVEAKKPLIDKHMILGVLFLAGLFIGLICLIYLWRYGA